MVTYVFFRYIFVLFAGFDRSILIISSTMRKWVGVNRWLRGDWVTNSALASTLQSALHIEFKRESVTIALFEHLSDGDTWSRNHCCLSISCLLSFENRIVRVIPIFFKLLFPSFGSDAEKKYGQQAFKNKLLLTWPALSYATPIVGLFLGNKSNQTMCNWDIYE